MARPGAATPSDRLQNNDGAGVMAPDHIPVANPGRRDGGKKPKSGNPRSRSIGPESETWGGSPEASDENAGNTRVTGEGAREGEQWPGGRIRSRLGRRVGAAAGDPLIPIRHKATAHRRAAASHSRSATRPSPADWCTLVRQHDEVRLIPTISPERHHAVVGRLAQFGDPSITEAKVGDADLVIVRDGAVINAFAANCPHAGAPLAEGALCHHRLVCPWHKATFRGQRRIRPGPAGA